MKVLEHGALIQLTASQAALMYLKASGTSTGLSRFDAGDKDSDQYTDRRTAMVVLVIGGVLGLASFIMTLVSIASASVEEEGAAGEWGARDETGSRTIICQIPLDQVYPWYTRYRVHIINKCTISINSSKIPLKW